MSFIIFYPFGPVVHRAMSSQETIMADYFTHFSCLLDVGTPENAARALDPVSYTHLTLPTKA